VTGGQSHGRRADYDAGCRCQPCTTANTVYRAGVRQRRLDRRTLINGRLVAPLPAERHGSTSAYANHGCRCEPCVAAINAYSRDYHSSLPKPYQQRQRATAQQRRLDRRTLIDGRLVAPLPTERHGEMSAYTDHGCRCEPCVEANSAYSRDYQAGRRAA
jgi:hypothetical protein